MKKFLLAALAILMSISIFACSNPNDDQKDDNKGDQIVDNKDNNDNDDNEENKDNEDINNDIKSDEKELSARASIEDIANKLMALYSEYTNVRESYDAYMADLPEDEQITYEEYCSYQNAVSEVDKDAEWLMGFSEIPTGFSEAYCYQPMMMGQAFIGYIFRVEEGTDVEAFKKTLFDTCNPRWNVCTEANTTVCENFGDLVFFQMLVVANDDYPDGFTTEQQDGFYTLFVDTIKNN